MVEKIKKNIHHFILPIILIFLSKFNEKYYLQPDHDSLIPLYFIRILVVSFGIWLSISFEALINKYRQLKKENKKVTLSEQKIIFIVVFSWLLIWYGAWLIIYYPGSYTTDTLDTIRQFSYMKINDWFSYLHPLTYLFLYQFYPQVIVIGIAQILLCSFVFSEIISYLYSKFKIEYKWKILCLITFMIFFSSITSITYYTFFYMRDIPYSILHVYLSFYLFKMCIEEGKAPVSTKQLITILSLGLLLSIYRGEGWVILFTSLFALLLYGKFNLRSFAKVTISALIAFVFLDSILPKVLNVYSVTKNKYNLTLVAYPLGFILREGNYGSTGLGFMDPEPKNYISSNYEEDARILSKVIDLKAIQEHTNSYDIMDFQHEGNYWNRSATDEDWKQFYARAYKIFWENPHLFLAARTANFISQLFIPKNRAERTNDTGRYALTYNECKNNKDNQWCQVNCDEIMFRVLEMLPVCATNKGVCGNVSLMKLDKIDFDWHWNSIMALLMSILTLFLYKYLPISAIASTVILSRIPLVFLTAPCAFFRYVFSLYLFGIFILFFVGLEILQSRKLSKRAARVNN